MLRHTVVGLALLASSSLFADLPEGYAPLSYIQSDGTAWVITPCTPASTDRIEMEITVASTNRTQALWCSRGSNASKDTFTAFLYAGWFRFDRNNSSAGQEVKFHAEPSGFYKLVADGNARTVTIADTGYSGALADGDFTPGSKLSLFASHTAGTALSRNSEVANYGEYVCHSFRVFDKDGNLRCECLPARRQSDGLVSMFETVSGTFLTPCGGVFDSDEDPVRAFARLGMTFDTRTDANDAGAMQAHGCDLLQREYFTSGNLAGSWALDGSKLPAGGLRLYSSPLSNWDGALCGYYYGEAGEVARSFAVSIVAKIADVEDQVLWQATYGGDGKGVYLHTVRNAQTGGLDLSLGWLSDVAAPAVTNIIAENIDTTGFHHYVFSSMKDSPRALLYIDGARVDYPELKNVKWYNKDSSGQWTSLSGGRIPASKSYRLFYIGGIRNYPALGKARAKTLYDDVRFFAGDTFTEELPDGSRHTAAINAAAVDALYQDLQVPRNLEREMPPARLGFTFDTRSLSNDVGFVQQVGTDTNGWSFVHGSHMKALNGALIDPTKGLALYAAANSWNDCQMSSDETVESPAEVGHSFALSLYAKIGDVDDSVLAYMRYGSLDRGTVLMTVRDPGSGRLDLALGWSNAKGLPVAANVIYRGIDTTAFHHYVVSVTKGGKYDVYVDGWIVDDPKITRVDYYTSADGLSNRNPSGKSYSALYLGALPGNSAMVGRNRSATLYDDVRFFSGEQFGGAAIDALGVEALYSWLVSYRWPGFVLYIR